MEFENYLFNDSQEHELFAQFNELAKFGNVDKNGQFTFKYCKCGGPLLGHISEPRFQMCFGYLM